MPRALTALKSVKIALDFAASNIAYCAKVVAGKRFSLSVPMRCAGICATDVYNPRVDKIRSLHASMAPRVALIAHDTCKADLTEWAIFNRETLDRCELYATGTTGERIERATGLPVERSSEYKTRLPASPVISTR